MADSPLKIVQADLIGDCKRLNWRFDLIEDRESQISDQIKDLQGAVTTVEAATNTLPATAVTVPEPLSAPATANLTLTTSLQVVVGLTVTLTRTGWWKIDLTVGFLPHPSDGTTTANVLAGATTLPGAIQVAGTGGQVFAVTRPWLFKSVTGAEVLTVQAKKASGAGTSTITGTATTASQVSQIVAVWLKA